MAFPGPPRLGALHHLQRAGPVPERLAGTQHYQQVVKSIRGSAAMCWPCRRSAARTPRWSARGCAGWPTTWACAAWSTPGGRGRRCPGLPGGGHGLARIPLRADVARRDRAGAGLAADAGPRPFLALAGRGHPGCRRAPGAARRPSTPRRSAGCCARTRTSGWWPCSPARGQPPAAGRRRLEHRVGRPGLRPDDRPLGAVRAARPLRGRAVVRRHDLPVRVGLRRERPAALPGRPAARRRAVGRAACTTRRPCCTRPGSPRPATIPTTGTARPGSPGGSTPSGSARHLSARCAPITSPTPSSPGPPPTTSRSPSSTTRPPSPTTPPAPRLAGPVMTIELPSEGPP